MNIYDYNIIPCSSMYMIDEGSVARNSLLVAIYFMGGAEECARPPYYIHEVSIEACSYLVHMGEAFSFSYAIIYLVCRQ